MDGTTRRADVVVVGLGPVGAVAANLAGQAGLDVIVIDRELAPFALPRAIVFDAEIMRVFASIGLAKEIDAITRPLGGSVYLGADHDTIRTFRSPGAAHPHAWAPSNLFYQPRLEQAIRDGLRRFPNVRVRSGCEITGVEPGPDGASLHGVDRDGGAFEVDARFVLACDGASSTIRKRLGIPLQDIGFLERWLVIDAHMHGPMRWPATHAIPPEVRDDSYSLMVCDPDQPATLIPGVGDHRRWEYMLLVDESDEDAVDPARLRARIGVWADPGEVEIVRSAVYRFRALVAERWREGAVFLLGDAAHQTPPFFGQGMCHGIRDAAQLMWKLVLVLRGHAADSILDTYQTERDAHVRAIIAASVAAGAAVCITDPVRARARDAEFRAIEAARGNATVAMTDVVPPIRDGFIDRATGGRRLPEIAIADGEGVRRLDEHLGGGFAVVSCTHVPLPRSWSAIGGRAVILADGLRDVDGRVARWLADNDALAAVVRPDRYVYGLARTHADVDRLAREISARLAPPVAAHLELETPTP